MFLFVLGCDDFNTQGLGDEIHGRHVVSLSNDGKCLGITCWARETGGRLGGDWGACNGSQWERLFEATKEQAAQVSGVKLPH